MYQNFNGEGKRQFLHFKFIYFFLFLFSIFILLFFYLFFREIFLLTDMYRILDLYFTVKIYISNIQ
jgi:hypothetical protein